MHTHTHTHTHTYIHTRTNAHTRKHTHKHACIRKSELIITSFVVRRGTSVALTVPSILRITPLLNLLLFMERSTLRLFVFLSIGNLHNNSYQY